MLSYFISSNLIAGMTYFSTNPRNLYIKGSERNFNFSCALSTDLSRDKWTFGWSDGNQSLTSGTIKNGKLFTTYNIPPNSNSSFVTRTILIIRIANQTSLFASPSMDQFYCFAFNTNNNMKLNSRVGHLYNVGK